MALKERERVCKLTERRLQMNPYILDLNFQMK